MAFEIFAVKLTPTPRKNLSTALAIREHTKRYTTQTKNRQKSNPLSAKLILVIIAICNLYGFWVIVFYHAVLFGYDASSFSCFNLSEIVFYRKETNMS
jgi:hypothetical protein